MTMHAPLARDPEMLSLLGLEGRAAQPPASPVVLHDGLGSAGGDDVAMQGAYDASSRFDRDMMSWYPSQQSANEDLLPEKEIIDSRVRDTMRNDAYAAAGGDIWKNNIVGAMFLLNSKPNYKYLGLDSTWAEEYQEEVESKFTLAAESPMNWLDASRTNNFTAMVRLAVGSFVMTGEVLAFGDWISERGDPRPFKTAIQMIDLDRLSDPPTKDFRSKIRGGIEFDDRNRPIAYHIRRAETGNWFSSDAYKWERVPTLKNWGRQQIIHIFEQFRPAQSRGVAKMVAALKESRITKRFRDVVLQNAVVNATYAATIESDLPSAEIYAMLGASGTDQAKVQAAVAQYGAGFLGALNQYAAGAKNMQLDGVRIPHLFPGSKLKLSPAGEGGPLGTEFEQSLLRYIAANLGVSYEQLSKDYSSTNYSSARAAMTETWKTMQAMKKIVADRFASHVYMLWLEEMFARGEITSLPRNAPNFWDKGRMNRDAYASAEWIGASRGQIDELKETQAAVLRLKYGLSTREDELGRLGKDWRRVFEQLEREERVAKEKNLVFTEDDNMMNAATGAPREKTAKGEKDDGSEDNTDA